MVQEEWNGCFHEIMASEVSMLVRKYKEEPNFRIKQVLGEQLLEMFEELDIDFHYYPALLEDIQSKYQFFI